MQEVKKFSVTNGDEVILRLATPEDAGEIIVTLRSTSLERSYVLMEQYGKDIESEREYIRGIDRKNNLLIVATVRGKVVGTLAAFQANGGQRPETAHVLFIGLHIVESLRGLGIGSQMLRYTVEWAAEHGFKKLEASIFTTNKRSLHVFNKAGFEQECKKLKKFRIGHDYIDEVCMGRFLD
ncbi:MAG TPA: GNAT family N-acetyltransferase [Thermodesulfovibrionales bacterium]|nr:GNAT family N-acetyltransferase [Thermodesulfovibrionales bacterium]